MHHSAASVVAIGKPEWQVREAWHWRQATIEITCHDHSIIACLCYIYLDVFLHTHPVHGESHIQCNTNREVATTSLPFYNKPHILFVRTFFLWRLRLARPSHPGHSTILLRLDTNFAITSIFMFEQWKGILS